MVLSFNHDLRQALDNIQTKKHHQIIVYEDETERTCLNSCEIIEKYGRAKWKVVDLLNKEYNTKFNLYHWLEHDQDDEVAYFLNEAGSNVLSYSQFKAPSKFHLWLGKKGFIIGMEQKGKSFNAEEINLKKIKNNEGAAFTFFNRCQSQIFFDNPQKARIIFFKYDF